MFGALGGGNGRNVRMHGGWYGFNVFRTAD